MIHDLTNLEPLLDRYDPRKILVGPLFDLWTNSSFRAFNIAGKSDQIYETIGLGFFEVEIDAQRRRDDVVAEFENHFGEVQTFNSQLEMAQTAHTLWANDETARFLASVSRQSTPRPTRATGHQLGPAMPDNFNGLPGKPGLSDTTVFANPETIADSGSNLETVRNETAPVAGNSAANKYRLWALSGLAAYLMLSFFIGFLLGTTILTSSTSVRQIAKQVMLGRKTAPITPGDDSSQATGTVRQPIVADSIGAADREAQPTEALGGILPSLVLADGGVRGGEAGAARLPREQPSQEPTDQAEAATDEQSAKATPDNQADGSISLQQSVSSQMANTEPSVAQAVPLSTPQPSEAPPAPVVSPNTQIISGDEGRELSRTEAMTSQTPEASSIELQRASISAIIPLPRPRPAEHAVPSDRSRHRVAPVGEGARGPLSSLFGSFLKTTH